MLALAALSVACAKRYEVRIDDGYAEPLNLNLVVALEPGNRKSTVFSQITRPLMDYEEETGRSFRQEFAVANQRREAEEARLKVLNGRLAKAREGPEREALGRQTEELAARLAELQLPSPPRTLADNATPERLTSLLAQNGGRVGVLSPEGELFE